MSRIGVLTTEQADRVRDAGGEPLEFDLPEARPTGGVALVREWVADTTEILLGAENPDALLIEADSPAELVGLFLAAQRLYLPTVVARRDDAYTAALTALGAAPLKGDAAGTVVEIADNREPSLGELVGNFSLANALRVGLSMGGGPELMVHLSAVAREGDVSGFNQMLRVLTPETAEVGASGLQMVPGTGARAAAGAPGRRLARRSDGCGVAERLPALCASGSGRGLPAGLCRGESLPGGGDLPGARRVRRK